jgi:CRP-like cAMP-binding protein
MSSNQTLEGFQLMGAGAAFKSEICSMISDMPLFRDLGWVDIESLSNYVQCYQVAAKTIIFKEGEVGNYMCLLIKGGVDIVKEDHEGRQHRLGLVGRGKTFGEMSLIDNEPRSATCIASQDCVMLLLTKANYGRILKERPGLAAHILAKLAKLMSQRLRALSGKMVEHLDQ